MINKNEKQARALRVGLTALEVLGLLGVLGGLEVSNVVAREDVGGGLENGLEALVCGEAEIECDYSNVPEGWMCVPWDDPENPEQFVHRLEQIGCVDFAIEMLKQHPDGWPPSGQ